MENRPTSLLLLVSQLLCHVTSSNATDLENFNIYEDYNLEEVFRAKEILKRFDDFVVQLLCEFEDHPALLQVFVVANSPTHDVRTTLLRRHFNVLTSL